MPTDDVRRPTGILQRGVTNPDRALLVMRFVFRFRVKRAVRRSGGDSRATSRGVAPGANPRRATPSGLMLGLGLAKTKSASTCLLANSAKQPWPPTLLDAGGTLGE